jgi:hypothetical protein
MIIWGLSVQNKEPKIPKEVADWLKPRNAQYADIKFEISHGEVTGPQPQIEAYLKQAEQYQKFYQMKGPGGGVLSVSFPYKKEGWAVKIMGLLDKDGNIVNTLTDETEGKDLKPLPPEMRNAIAGLPKEKDKIAELEQGGFAEVREANNPLKEKPEEMVEIEPDFRHESELTMSGAEFEQILKDPRMDKAELGKAFHEKNWEKIKHMRRGLNN